MEPWNCLSDGKGTCFDNEMDISIDSFGRSRNSIFGTDQKTSNCVGNDGLMSDFVDIGLPDVDSGKAAGDSSVKLVSSCLIASNLSFGLKECYPKLSKSLVGSKDGEFSIGEDRSVVSSLIPSPGAKKARSVGSCSQTPFCQVHGCNINLTSSKDYHKRHRVCEVHSKTAKVIVNGIEQRFCQQCSRFHLLAEFDDGKRSCRRRLAGHNERRRKPQFHFLSSKQHKLLHSYKGKFQPFIAFEQEHGVDDIILAGSKLFEGSLTRRSYFGFPEVYSGGFSCEDGYEQSNNYKLIKFEDKSVCSPRPAISFVKGHTQQKPSLSHRALSLLSVQSQQFPDQVTGAPYVRFSQAGRAHQNMGQKFGKDDKGPSGSIPVSTGLSDSVMANLCRSKVSDFQTDEFFEDSTFQNPGQCFPPGNAPMVDLLQLSSHLQRVEQQKSSVQVKHEIAEPCYFLGT